MACAGGVAATREVTNGKSATLRTLVVGAGVVGAGVELVAVGMGVGICKTAILAKGRGQRSHTAIAAPMPAAKR